jgi:hypothetical protein
VRERHRRGRQRGDRGDQGDDSRFLAFFSDTAAALTTKLDPGLVGQHWGQCAATPGGVAGAMLQRVVLDEAVEVLFQRAGDLGGRPERGRSTHPCVPWLAKR